MFLANLSVRKSVLATILLLALVVIGIFSYLRLTIDLMPPVDFPYVTVVTVYPGAGPEEIESLVSKPIEDAISSISGLKNTWSYSQEGVSVVLAEFTLETKVDFAAMDVKEKVDAVRSNLPDDVETPTISKFDFSSSPILNLAVTSQRPIQETYEIADKTIKRELSKVNGLAQIEVVGGRKREIAVLVSKDKLKGYDLSITDVIAAIAAENLNIPGGHITEESREYGVRVTGEFESVDEIRNVRIQRTDAPPVRLSEVANVQDSFAEVRELARYNRNETVGMTLRKRSDANTVKVASGVKKTLERLKQTLPADVKIEIARDRSTFIKDMVADLNSNMITGIILTALVLFLFLHSWEGIVIAGIAMPVSVVSTYTFLYFAGFTINVMSLMGLALCVGILIANSLVVMENIYRYLHMGKGPREAAEEGTSEIALAVLASTLTNVVVFVPIAFMSGIIGQLFRQFGLTTTFATFVSLLVSFTATPMLASKLLSSRSVDKKISWHSSIPIIGKFLELLDTFFAKWDAFYEGAAASYRRGLDWTLNHRWRVIGISLGVFVVSLALVPFIGTEFFQNSDQGMLTVSVEMPVGSNLWETQKAIESVEQVVSSVPETESFFSSVGSTESELGAGGSGVNVGDVLLVLVDKRERKRSDKDIAAALRTMLAEIPGAKLTVSPASTMGGGGEKDIQIEVTGDEMPVLISVANKVVAIAQETPGTVDVDTDWRIGKPEMKLVPLREKSADYGVSTAELANLTRAFITGTVASQFRDRDEEYDIRVKLDESDRDNIEKLGSLLVRTGNGTVPVAELASITHDEGPTQIVRKNRQRMITVSANIARGTLGGLVGQLKKKTDALSLPPGYRIYYGGMAEIMGESFASLFQALILAIVLTYMLLAAMLDSYVHPFTIMLTVPLGAVGVLLALFFTGRTISIFSLMALIMLVGIVVNNAILLLDYTNTLRKKGYNLREAILEACPTRLRPIVMSNLAAAMAMLPLALGLGAGAEFRSPMAIVSIGGLVVSTVFTLFLIPTVYSLLDRFAEGKGR
ncbi:MAG: efflux RND transporter permease subunit [Candidatus Eisenbacteria bacterium]|nr:efflux RND transporter permease subunit [Candidatus Eisenbacteria bacterium]